MSSAATGNRAYGASVFALELDKTKNKVGLFKSLEGGNIKAEPIKYQNGFDRPIMMRSGRPKCDDIKCQVGMAMGEPFFAWIAKFVQGIPERKTGAIVAGDFYFNERARREFDQAMISEVNFPKLDGADKAACYLGVTITAETIVYKPGTGEKIEEGPGFQSQKLWAACNFDMKLDGFAQAMGRVTKVDAFAIKQKPIDYNVGMRRDTMKLPGRVEYPNLVFYIPEADAQPFQDYHAMYNIEGAVQKPERLTGEINTYDNKGGPLFTVQFAGADIFSVTHDKRDATSEDIAQVKVELTTEHMAFKYLAATLM